MKDAQTIFNDVRRKIAVVRELGIEPGSIVLTDQEFRTIEDWLNSNGISSEDRGETTLFGLTIKVKS